MPYFIRKEILGWHILSSKSCFDGQKQWNHNLIYEVKSSRVGSIKSVEIFMSWWVGWIKLCGQWRAVLNKVE